MAVEGRGAGLAPMCLHQRPTHPSHCPSPPRGGRSPGPPPPPPWVGVLHPPPAAWPPRAGVHALGDDTATIIKTGGGTVLTRPPPSSGDSGGKRGGRGAPRTVALVDPDQLAATHSDAAAAVSGRAVGGPCLARWSAQGRFGCQAVAAACCSVALAGGRAWSGRLLVQHMWCPPPPNPRPQQQGSDPPGACLTLNPDLTAGAGRPGARPADADQGLADGQRGLLQPPATAAVRLEGGVKLRWRAGGACCMPLEAGVKLCWRGRAPCQAGRQLAAQLRAPGRALADAVLRAAKAMPCPPRQAVVRAPAARLNCVTVAVLPGAGGALTAAGLQPGCSSDTAARWPCPVGGRSRRGSCCQHAHQRLPGGSRQVTAAPRDLLASEASSLWDPVCTCSALGAMQHRPTRPSCC
jgi:hypothetical protein